MLLWDLHHIMIKYITFGSMFGGILIDLSLKERFESQNENFIGWLISNRYLNKSNGVT